VKRNQAAQRLRWSKKAAVWRSPSPSVTVARPKERPWIFLASTVVIHGAVLLAIPRTEAARHPPRPAPIVVERVVRAPTPPAPTPMPTPPAAPAPAKKRVAVAKKARIVEAPSAPAPTATPKKIVGLSLSATVDGGGAAFRVGETGRGVTEVAPVPVVTAPATTPGTTAGRPRPGVVLELPRRLRAVEPIYPDEYRGQRIEGQVTIALVIDADGSIGNVELVTPSPHPAFNRSAVATAKRERFAPATQNGVPIPHTIRCTYHFKLSS
jgi:protein TonB